jgi:hypothetical protein
VSDERRQRRQQIVARCRQRQRDGKLVLVIEVDEIEVSDLLRASNCLSAIEPSREDIARAVEKFLSLSYRAAIGFNMGEEGLLDN